MKIGIVSQKGGVGKSTLSRLLAREYALNDWSVLIADMDTSQATSTNWQRRRCEHDLLPYIASQQFTHVHQVNKQVDHYDLIIFDGAPHATQATKEIASLSDLIIIPTGLSIDDLEPTIRLCNSLKEGGIDLKKIAIAFCRIGDNVAEVEEAEGYINKTPYFLLGGYKVTPIVQTNNYLFLRRLSVIFSLLFFLINLIRRFVIQRLMRSDRIVKFHISGDCFARFYQRFIGFQIHFLVFDGSPESLNRNIIQASSFSIHTNFDSIFGHGFKPSNACKLRPLI